MMVSMSLKKILLWDQFDSTCPVLFAKNFRFAAYPNQIYIPRRPAPHKGRIAIVTDAGRDAVDAGCVGRAM